MQGTEAKQNAAVEEFIYNEGLLQEQAGKAGQTDRIQVGMGNRWTKHRSRVEGTKSKET